eukprot:2907181-Prymnesium_polylepis.1
MKNATSPASKHCTSNSMDGRAQESQAKGADKVLQKYDMLPLRASFVEHNGRLVITRNQRDVATAVNIMYVGVVPLSSPATRSIPVHPGPSQVIPGHPT